MFEQKLKYNKLEHNMINIHKKKYIEIKIISCIW